MIALAVVLGLYIVMLWWLASLDCCRLCGAKPEGEFGCPLCKRHP